MIEAPNASDTYTRTELLANQIPEFSWQREQLISRKKRKLPMQATPIPEPNFSK